MCKCKYIYVNNQDPEILSLLLGQKLYEMHLREKGNHLVLRSIRNPRVQATERRDHPAYQHTVQKSAAVTCRVNMALVTFMKDPINDKWNIQVMEQHMVASSQCVSQGRFCLFQRDNVKLNRTEWFL